MARLKTRTAAGVSGYRWGRAAGSLIAVMSIIGIVMAWAWLLVLGWGVLRRTWEWAVR